MNLQPYIDFCEWGPTTLFFFSSNVFGPLIYYSHLIPVLLALPLAAWVLYVEPTRKLNIYFFLLVCLFSSWALGDLILWAHSDPGIIMTFWSFLILIEVIIYIIAFCFVHQALYQKSPNVFLTLTLSALVLPTILLLPTNLAIESFNLTNCWREVTEGPLVFYGYSVQVLIAISIAIMTIFEYIKSLHKKAASIKTSILISIATLCFLGVFSSGNIIGSFSENWLLGQYATFGMPILVAIMGYLITQYRVFKSNILSSELLVAAVAILTIGLSFIQNLETVRTVSLITFGLVLILGAILIRSVRRESKQLAEIEHLAEKLAAANQRLKILDQMKSEFVSIASHQLRSPLTSIRGYASMLLEGSYGKLPEKGREAIEKIAESSRFMALSVEDYLNVSRIQSGNMKYENSDFNLKDVAFGLVDDLRREAVRKGLVLKATSDLQSTGIVHADIGKTRQVIQNLIDNAMKYTKKGTITVTVRDQKKPKKIFVDISDTGIGMSPETIEALFDKFERAHNANEVNVTGTGLGLYIARKIARDMGGEVTAHSKGEGEGSTFILELPLQM